MTRIILALFMMFCFSTETAYGVSLPTDFFAGDMWIKDMEVELFESVPETAQDWIGDGNISKVVEGTTTTTFIENVSGYIEDFAKAPFRILLTLCGMMMLGSVLEIFHSTLNKDSGRELFSVIISCAVVMVVVTPVVECIDKSADALIDYSFFTATFIPTLAGIMTATGQPLTGSAFNILLFGICQITGYLISRFFTPLLCGYLALATVSVICPTLQINQLINGMKTFVLWGLSLSLTVFLGVLSLQGVVASSGDQVALKTAKFMIGSLIPGIGGALSDLFIASQGWLEIAKNTVGVFGVIVTTATFLPIIIEIGLWYLALNCTSLVGSMLGQNQISGLVKSIGSTLGIMLAVLIYQSLLVIISSSMMMLAFKAM